MGESPPLAGPPPETSTRTRVRILLVFLGAFLALLIVFRAVLFPFLMAIFLAYLIEPLVGWISRTGGGRFRVGRGLAVVLTYAALLVGLFFGGTWAGSKLWASARQAFTDLEHELSKTAPAGRLSFDVDSPADVWIPAGTRLVDDASSRAFKTSFPAQIDAGRREVRVLLEPEVASDVFSLRPGTPLRLADRASVDVPEGFTLDARAGETAKGLEVFTERRVIGPVARLVERMTGSHFDPAAVREFVADKSHEQQENLGKTVVDWGRRAIVGVFLSTYQLILVLMLTAFMVVDRQNIARFFASLPPPHLRPHYRRLIEYVDRGLAGVIRGQLMICVVNGLLTWLGLALFRIPYAPILALVAGVFSLIPVFGTIASSIPIMLVALAAGGVQAGLVALAWICLIHLLEANLFNPLIMGTNAEMHPVVIVFALLAGEHAFGVWGALLAVPTASILQSCFKYYRHEIEGVPVEEAQGHGAWLKRLLTRRKTRAASATASNPEGASTPGGAS